MPDFIAQLLENPTEGLHDALIALYDALLNDPAVSTEDKAAIARVRAQTDIGLKGLN